MPFSTFSLSAWRTSEASLLFEIGNDNSFEDQSSTTVTGYLWPAIIGAREDRISEGTRPDRTEECDLDRGHDCRIASQSSNQASTLVDLESSGDDGIEKFQ